MNTISVKIDRNENVYDSFANFYIDGVFLNERLNQLYANRKYADLVPTLLYDLENSSRECLAWNMIDPEIGEKVICPIYVSAKNCNFSDKVIVAELINLKHKIIWNRVGICTEYLNEFEFRKESIDWLQIESLTFGVQDRANAFKKFRNSI